MRRIVTFLACFALASASAACASPADEYCEAKCDCQNCSNNQFDECLIVYQADEDIADAYGCSRQFEDRHFCILDRYECAFGVFDEGVLRCGNERDDLNRCR
jgi:hypothetical protein